MAETIVQYLERMRAKDLEKHGPEAAGVRSTREIADHFALAPAQARRDLNKLYAAGQIEAYDGGRETLWAELDEALERLRCFSDPMGGEGLASLITKGCADV